MQNKKWVSTVIFSQEHTKDHSFSDGKITFDLKYKIELSTSSDIGENEKYEYEEKFRKAKYLLDKVFSKIENFNDHELDTIMNLFD